MYSLIIYILGRFYIFNRKVSILFFTYNFDEFLNFTSGTKLTPLYISTNFYLRCFRSSVVLLTSVNYFLLSLNLNKSSPFSLGSTRSILKTSIKPPLSSYYSIYLLFLYYVFTNWKFKGAPSLVMTSCFTMSNRI